MAIIGQDSGTYTKADADRKRELAKQLMGSGFRAKNPLGALAMALEGGISGMYDKEASGAEAAGSKQIAELLQGKDYMGVMGNEWANPQQSALASMLQGRDWQQQDQAANWAREDQRAAAAASRPEFKMFEAGGDQYRYNANDPNSRPELFFDGPEVTPDPFTLGENDTRYAGDGSVIAQGAPKTPDTVINNNLGGTDEFYKKLDTDAGAQQAALLDAGRNAASNNLRLEQLQSHLANAPQGAEGAIAQFAGRLGIPTEGLDDIQAAQALINQLVPGQRPPGSGTMSDADLVLFKQSLPAIANQAGGNAAILKTTMAINEYTMAQAAIAEKVANREISPAEGRELQRQVHNPLANFNLQGEEGQSGWTDIAPGIRIREK